MPDEHPRKKPAAKTPAEQLGLPQDENCPAPVKPLLTGMTGMHIDRADEDTVSGSPGADIDRDVAEDE
ncbi:hypothetical protein JQ621_34685 [Bradyrhizobium manausense]|uniref:hypothetical protein n=1 Tax=Bradyrhizobium manausense TaxID=989370 RepID=UPI001BAB5BC7|nr:hypothetical protein [Bradyrhizobium manausense]MBR1092621.1 hypothetical protein [Bradyrhizobium manausense]